jgi:hypothetical protein
MTVVIKRDGPILIVDDEVILEPEGLEPVLVLFTARPRGSWYMLDDSLMIHVRSSNDIIREFDLRIREWNNVTYGPAYADWNVTGYIPRCGRPVF